MFEELDNILKKMGVVSTNDIKINDILSRGKKGLSVDELNQVLQYHEEKFVLKIKGMEENPVLYIKYVSSKYTEKYRDASIIENRHKFHIMYCSTLRGFFCNGKGDKYIFVPAKGDVLQHIFDYNNKKQELLVCKYCLTLLKEKLDFYKSPKDFKLEEILGRYMHNILKLPASEWLVPRETGYTNNWQNKSRTYRKEKDWKCEECRVDCSFDTGLLDVHHIDGNSRHNDNKNLKALCKDCHSKQFRHQHCKLTEDQLNRINELRNKVSRETLTE